MAISFKSLNRAKAPNNSQVFRSSGTFTVPSGVSKVHVKLRGGNGTAASFYGGSGGQGYGTAGGNTTVLGVTAEGGPAGSSGISGTGNSTYVGHDASPAHNPVIIEFYSDVTPGQSVTVTVGSGLGSYAIISWGA